MAEPIKQVEPHGEGKTDWSRALSGKFAASKGV